MTETFTLATAQSRISSDIHQNAQHICDLMRQAKARGARLIHFPEGALSGYVKSEIKDWRDVDWNDLARVTDSIRNEAAKLGLWTILGCNHRVNASDRPYNSLYVVSETGDIAARYDKRYCAHTEITDWYKAGKRGEEGNCIFELDGFSFGCALCIEINFMDIFDLYEKQDVDCVLYSAYSPDPVFWIQARGYAATTNMWISAANPANCSDGFAAGMIAPNGYCLHRGNDDLEEDLLISVLDKSDPALDIALNKARPWRRTARKGDIYAD